MHQKLTGATAMLFFVLACMPAISGGTATSLGPVGALPTSAPKTSTIAGTPGPPAEAPTATPSPGAVSPTRTAPRMATGSSAGTSGAALQGLPAVATGVSQARPVATASPSDRPSVRAAASIFPLGVFEDGNVVGGSATTFRKMIEDLQARGLDSIMFSNNFVERDAPLLAVSDELQANVFMMPAGDLYRTWWPAAFPADIQTARSVARPVIEQWGPHPSLKGYLLIDEPNVGETEKITLLAQAFHELDPARPVMPILIGVNRVEPIFTASQPDVMLINVYPAGYGNAPCDFTLTGFGYNEFDFVSYTRRVTRAKPPEVPLWMILQTHAFYDENGSMLREPLPTEVRLQHWLALGEGATGIFWFIYSSQQGWTGLADNPALYAEVTRLAQRTGPLRDHLLGLHKVADQFTVSGKHDPYISTLASADGSRLYAVAVNQDCRHARWLRIDAPGHTGRLRDVETNRTYRLGGAIEFQPGDGKLFELVDPYSLPIILP